MVIKSADLKKRNRAYIYMETLREILRVDLSRLH